MGEKNLQTPSLMSKGIVLPRDPASAAAEMMKLSQGGRIPPFWHANPRTGLHLSDHRPQGTRPFPHVAIVEIPEELLSKGRVRLRYHDGSKVELLLTELAAGSICLPCEIAERWMIAEKGEKDMAGRLHE